MKAAVILLAIVALAHISVAHPNAMQMKEENMMNAVNPMPASLSLNPASFVWGLLKALLSPLLVARSALIENAPSMGVVGYTVRSLVTGWNPVGLLLTPLGLDAGLAYIVDVLFTSGCSTDVVSNFGVLGNILWAVLLAPNPVSGLLFLLGLSGFVNTALKQLFLANCS